jgi:hypothetical protein
VKTQIDTLDAMPSKRLFLSIIADYDLNRSVCELVDNGLDVWVRNSRKQNIAITLTLDKDQQTISVEDNAGGLAKDELRYIVGPGHTGSQPTDETIGIFGVGTKRAVVALAQDIRIRTRFRKEATYEIDLDDEWLAQEEWELPVYRVDPLREGTTLVSLSRLRVVVSDATIGHLRDYLSATYARFLTGTAVRITLNGVDVVPQFFDNWAYPPDYSPRRYSGTLTTQEGRGIRVEAMAGLSSESSPAAGEYGVYFYCNDRLIARALKTYDVGFTRGLAGLPHPKVSLARLIVCLNGDAQSMPWNSSKSDVSTKHEVFIALHEWIVQVVKDYASLSRIWMGEWPEKVFRYKTGEIEEVEVSDFPSVRKSFLPPLPRSRPRYGEVLTKANSRVSKQKPWTTGLYEGIIAADLISKQKLEQRNRIAFIVLDSTLEIGFKEFLVNESGVVYTDAKLLSIFSNRASVQTEVQKYLVLKPDVWKKIDHFYRLRNKLVHERATVGISDEQVHAYRSVVEDVLKKMYKLKFH